MIKRLLTKEPTYWRRGHLEGRPPNRGLCSRWVSARGGDQESFYHNSITRGRLQPVGDIPLPDVNQLGPKETLFSAFLNSSRIKRLFPCFFSAFCSFCSLEVPGGVHPCIPLYTPLGTPPPPAGHAGPLTAACETGPYRRGPCLDSCNNVLLQKMPAKSVLNLVFPAFGHVWIQLPNQLLYVLDRDLLAPVRLPNPLVARR